MHGCEPLVDVFPFSEYVLVYIIIGLLFSIRMFLYTYFR